MNLLKEQQEIIDEKKHAKKQIEKKKNFRRIFLGIAASMLFVIFLAFGLVYRDVKKIIIEQNVQMSMEAFLQASAQVEEANKTAVVAATQVILDDICSDFLAATSDKSLNSIARAKVRNQLSMFQTTNPEIESIYMYNRLADLFVSSGSRLNSVGKREFADQDIVKLLEQGENYNTRYLLRRERKGLYPASPEETETVYSYIMSDFSKVMGNAVVINMKFDSMLERIRKLELMKDSQMVILDGSKERLVEISNITLEKSENLRKIVQEMIDTKQNYREVKIDGIKYFLSVITSKNSPWIYVKATVWDTMFANLLHVRVWMMFFLIAAAVGVLLIALGNSLSILRIHTSLEKKYAVSLETQIKKSDMNVLQEGFLNDFLHGRKLFGRNRLHQEMEKFGFSIQEEDRYMVVVLQILAYERFLELFGKKSAYDIKYGFQNIFAETFEKEFKSISLINRDDTITFMLDTGGVETPAERIAACFEEFVKNVKVFAEWEFMLYGADYPVHFEKLPEMNAELKNVVPEGFFYPANTFLTCKQIKAEHGAHVDLNKLDVEFASRILKMDKNVKEVYGDFAQALKACTTSDYMKIMLWLGITISRGTKLSASMDREGSDLLVSLSGCDKASQVDTLFYETFDRILQNKEKHTAKKGVSGRLSEVKNYIEENFRNPNLTLEQLGDEFSVSPNYLGQLFKKEMGVSVSDYISAQRLEWVLNELAQTDRSAKDIAEDAGYVSSNYFYTYFRKKVGVTPQAYREQIRNGNGDAVGGIEGENPSE